MARRRFVWQLYAICIGITLAILLAASEYAAASLKDFYYAETEKSLTSRARIVLDTIRRMGLDDGARIDAVCKELGHEAAVRITVVRPDGTVLGDSNAEVAAMENHAHRPEIRDAMAGRTGTSVRYSDTVREHFMYVAMPVAHGGELAGVVRVSLPLSSLVDTLGRFKVRLAVAVALMIVLGLGGISLLLRRLNRPLAEMRQGAARFAGGDLDFRLRAPEYEELAALVEALNGMAGQLKSRMETIARQRDEMQAVLGSMREAVIAVDADERVLQLNAAAAELLGVDAKAAVGQYLTAVIRNTDLLGLLRAVLEKHAAAEREVIIHSNGEEEHILQVHATPLGGGNGGGVSGAMIVANDITRLRRLERVRRDFVANVSHELKTPLTSIKGFVETLQEGALDQPDEARRFLGIIAKQVERLQAVLEDLLSLSRIDQLAERGGLRFQEEPIRPLLESAAELCERQASRKGISIEIACPVDARARMNADLFEQAAVNLIENAVKYSEPGRPIRIAVASGEGGWRIDFADQGCGIEAQHLERIFERFYRVDKARSRSEGGTGLGLSIVKHIMSAHGGSVSVVSAVGSGSTFTLFLPAA